MKKMNNKGFSMVELIIVIAIMAILAGAIAPTLIKYVNKSRMSSDVSNAQTIATSVQSALANQAANDDFQNNIATGGSYSGAISTLAASTGSFGVELKGILGNAPSVKYTKGLELSPKFYVYIQSGGSSADKVKVYVKDSSNGEIELYPNVNAAYE